MSGDRFLVSAKDVNCSEKIVKIKSLIKEGIDIDESVRPKETIANESEFISSVKATLDGINMSTLTDDTKQVVNHVAGYIAKKAAKSCNDCCEHQLLYEGPSNSNGYIAMLSRGGLKKPFRNLSECVEQGFAVLHNTVTQKLCKKVIFHQDMRGSSYWTHTSIPKSFVVRATIYNCLTW